MIFRVIENTAQGRINAKGDAEKVWAIRMAGEDAVLQFLTSDPAVADACPPDGKVEINLPSLAASVEKPIAVVKAVP